MKIPQLRRALRLPPRGGNFATDPLGPWAFDPGRGFERAKIETPEQRAYRRFPIDRHKPGGVMTRGY
jgi:hypothetical protein